MDEKCQFPIVSEEEHRRIHLAGPFQGPHAVHLFDAGYTRRDGTHAFSFRWACACWGSSENWSMGSSTDRAESLKHAVSLARQHLKRYGVGR